MYNVKALKKNITFFTVLLILSTLGGLGSYSLHTYGKYRTHKETRHARLMDVFDRESTYKGNHYYYTYGYFIDDLSGNHFTDDISEITFKQFKRDGYKSIDTSWPYNIDLMERTSKGFFALMFGSLGMILFGCVGVFTLSQLILSLHQYSEIKEQVQLHK